MVRILFSNNKRLLVPFFILLIVSMSNAATKTSTATGGTWTTGSTWVGGVAPASGDTVIIATTGSNSVSLGAAASITNVTVNAGATFNLVNRTLTISGFFTNNGTVTATSGQANLSTADFTNNGSYTMTTGRITTSVGNFYNTGTITFSAAGRLIFGGNYTNSGTITLGSALVQFTGAANQSIQGFSTTGTVSMLKTGGTASLTSDVTAGGLTINGIGGTLDLVSGTHSFSGTWTRTNGTLNCGSSLLRFGLSVSGTGGTFNAGTGTVEYYRSGSQTAAVVTYNNLILSGTSTKTFSTTPTVNGKLTLAGTAIVTVTTGVVTYGANATLEYDSTNIRTASSEEWISPFTATGGIIINGTNTITLNAAKVFDLSSPLTITSIGKLATNNYGLTFGGNYINNGGLFTAGSSPIVIANTMTIQSIAGFTTTGLVSMTKTAGIATLIGNTSSAGFTINGIGGTLNLGTGLVHTSTGAVNLSNGNLLGSTSTFNVNFTGVAWTGTGSNFTCGSGTVSFGGASQTLAVASTFNNLTFSNSGVKTLTGVPTVNGILSLEGTASVSAAPIFGSAATLQYNRAVAQVAGVEWISPFAATGGVFVSNTGMITANGIKVFNAGVPLTIDSDAILDTGGFSISGGSTITVLDLSTLQISGSGSFPVFASTALDMDSTVAYNGTAQTVAVQNYGNLLLSNSGNKTFAGTTTISGDFEISGAAVAILFNGTASSSGSLTLGGVLQTALGSWGGTSSVATNINGTWFGASTTGVVNILTSCLTGSWLGLTNTDWNTPTNWCGGTVPTALTDVSIGVNANQPVIGASGGICKNITIKTGATLTISGVNSLSVKGNWTNNGTFSANASTVSFNGTAVQTIGGSSVTIFNNLTNANTTNALTAAIGITIKNTLSNANSASVINMGAFVLTDGGGFSNSGAGKIITINTSSLPIPNGKTWTNTLFYSNPTGGQTIVSGTYNGSPAIELDNTSGTQTASGAIVTAGQLNINNGGTPIFDMNGYNLTTNALNVVAPNSILDMRAGILSYTTALSMDGTIRFSGASNGKSFSSGTVEYNGASQTVAAGNYNNLLFSGIGGVYTMASNTDVENTLNVTNGTLTVQDGITVSVGNAVTVTNPGSFILENNASLLQTSYTGSNTGNIIVKRNSTPIVYYDLTYWSSPTTGSQTLLNFSPQTRTDKFYSYNSLNDTWNTLAPATAVFEKGIGYAIQAPETASASIPTVDTSFQFVGVPNNGDIVVAVSTPPNDVGLSLLGNPYPSAINANDFINENLYDAILNPTNTLEGTLYFWSHNNRLIGNDFSNTDYYYYNLSGGSAGNSGTANNNTPDGFVASGQGFFIQNVIAGSLRFNNTMRETSNNSNFYKTKSNKKIKVIERDRIWLNLTNSSSIVSQALVGYIENATNEYDPGYDSNVFDDSVPFLLYSLIGTDKMAIQGRALPFEDTDTVPIGYSIDTEGVATITIDHMDGLFLDDQAIYLEDKLLNVIYDIKSNPYTFTSTIGTFNDRFVLRYTDPTLNTKSFDSLKNKPLVAVKNNQITINSFDETIDAVAIYDLLGKQIYQKTKVNSAQLSIDHMHVSEQVLIVKTTLQNGKTKIEKIKF